MGSLENSLPPQLIETTCAPPLTAVSTAPSRFENEALRDSTRRMSAPGAIACAHCTSSDVSSAQPLSVRGFDCA